MSKSQEDIEIEWQGEFINLTVEFSYYKGSRGRRDSLGGRSGMGPQLEPDEPPEVEILKAWNEDGDFALDDNIYVLIENALWKRRSENAHDAAADRAEAMMERKYF